MPDAYTPPGSSTSYDVPADLDAVDVSVWFEDFANTVDAALALKLANAPAKNTQTADFDFALTDAAGLLVVANKATAIAGTLKQNSAMASSWPTDSVIRFINRNDGVLTITAGSGVTIIGTPLTFAKGKGGALVWVAANTWVCVPFSGGADAAVLSGTTGSPATSSITGYALTTWTGNGSFTVGTAGLVTLLVVAGGGGGGSSRAGGAGGYVSQIVWLEPGTYDVVVGAGGVIDVRGGNSSVGSILAFAGGSNGDATFPLGLGGSGAATATPTGKNIPGQGNIGATGHGGGGGSGGAATGSTPSGVGGVGTAWIDGVTYAVGGSENAAVPGTGYGHGGRGTGGTQTAVQGVVILALAT
jgi:hypothetical protein